MNIRASRSTGTPARPPNGGSSACRRGRSSLRVTGIKARSSSPRTAPASSPAAAKARPTRGAFATAWRTVAASRAPSSARRSAGKSVSRFRSSRPPGRRSGMEGSFPSRRATGALVTASEPALAPLVELEIAVAGRAAAAEVELLHVLVRAELVGLAVEDDPAVLHDVAVVRDPEREVRVLLDEQEARLLLAVHALDDVEDFAHEQRREAERRLVEEDELRARHERAADREHLLLAAGEVAGEPLAALSQAREVVEHHLPVALEARPVVPGEPTHRDVLVDRQVLEDAAALHHLEDAVADDLLGRELVEPHAVELDGAVGDLSLLGVEEPGDGLERRRLAGPVRPEQRDDLPVRDLEREPLQDEDDVVVDDLDVLQDEHGSPGRRGWRRRSGVAAPPPEAPTGRATPACAPDRLRRSARACRPSPGTGSPSWSRGGRSPCR